MRIAYFITLHHKPDQFRWLFDAIYTHDDFYLIHIDKKAGGLFCRDIENYLGERPNVGFLTPRKRIAWGGWSLVAIELDAIRKVLSDWDGWDYFINLSGQDYPIKTVSEIKTRLEAAWPRNFIRVWPFAKVQRINPNDPHLSRSFAFEAFGRVIRTKIPMPFPKSVDIKFKGSNWHILARDFCAWAVDSSVAKQIERNVRHTLVPDEIFFQALIMHSPFENRRMDDCYRFVIWPGPKTLRDEDYDEIRRSDCLFARKFDQAVDRRILDRLAGDLGFKIPDRARDAAVA